MYVSVFFFLLGVLPYVLSEPSCSKFHYEEKLLEKMIRVEFEMEQFTKEFKRMKEIWESSLSEQEQKQTEMEQKQKHALEDLVELGKNVTGEMLAFGDKALTPVISFRARSPVDMTPSAGETIIYKTIEVNEGSGYNSDTGLFTVPVKGLYSFNMHACVSLANYFDVSIVKDGTQLAGTRLTDKSYTSCSSLISDVVLVKGDMVWIKCTDGGVLYDSAGHYWNMFSGSLIHV